MSANKQLPTVRKLAVQLLTQTETTNRYIDHLMETSLHVARLSPKDHALLLEITYGVLRHRTYLDAVIAHYAQKGGRSMQALLKNILRTAIYQFAFLRKIPDYAVVSEAVDLAKLLLGPRQAGFVNALLRTYLRAPFAPERPPLWDLPALSIYYSHPLWLVQRFVEQFGRDSLVQWMEANNHRPGVILRALHARGTEAGLEMLDAVAEMPGYYLLKAGVPLVEVPGWNEGKWLVQDASAGLAVQLVAAQPGETVIDLCAAPGGKAIVLSQQVERGGQVIAVEIAKKRLQKIEQNLQRTGRKNVKLVHGDARSLQCPPADAVLVDAPCSGLGVLAKRADLRWKRKVEDFPALVRLQNAILDNAAKLVKKGGRIVYSTCTIDKQENEGVVEAFLTRHPEFEIEPAAGFVHLRFVAGRAYVRTFPHLHPMDGSFAVRLKKRGTGL